MIKIADYRPGEIEYQTYGIDISGILQSIGNAFKNFFGFGDALTTSTTYVDVLRIAVTVLEIIAVLCVLLSIAMVYGWIYATVRLKKYEAETEEAIVHEEARWRERALGKAKKHPRRAEIAKHIESDNVNDWRIAIVEADILLEELLTERGFPGVTIGEKLRNASPESFRTLNDAWEAHKVRNKIAHEGGGFVLTERIARQAIAQYENVFQEFDA